MTLSHPESNELTGRIIGAAIEVHRYFGPGLLESAYGESLYWEMCGQGLSVERERSIPLQYKSHPLNAAYRADLIVENVVLVEVKAIEKTLAIHRQQTLTYMKLAGFKIGLLINFNVSLLVDGITRLSL
jgi:GxxExxY protein